MTSIISRPQLQTSYVCFHDSSSPYPDSVFKAFCKHIQNPQEYLFPWLLLEKTSQAFSLGNIFQLPVATSLALPQLLLGRLTSWQAAALLAQEAGPAQSERARVASGTHRLSGKTKLALQEHAGGTAEGRSPRALMCWLKNHYSFLSTETVK